MKPLFDSLNPASIESPDCIPGEKTWSWVLCQGELKVGRPSFPLNLSQFLMPGDLRSGRTSLPTSLRKSYTFRGFNFLKM